MNYNTDYAILGNDCIPQTIAIPSNTKFLSPFNNTYSKKYTKTLYYPGHEEDKILNNPVKKNIIDNIKNKIQDKSCTNC